MLLWRTDIANLCSQRAGEMMRFLQIIGLLEIQRPDTITGMGSHIASLSPRFNGNIEMARGSSWELGKSILTLML